MNSNISPEERDNASEIDSTKKRRKGDVVALIVCTLLAFVLWLAIRNATDEGDAQQLPPVYESQITETVS